MAGDMAISNGHKVSTTISIITPVFNGIRFIEFCLKNVIEQNCPFVEHLIVDGGSTDGTVDVIKSYAERNEHIRWVSEKDKGQSDAMNKGVAMATGNILSFLNVDDYYEPGALNHVCEKFVALPDPTFLVGNCNVWNDDGTILWVNKPANLKLARLLLNTRRYPTPINPSAYFYHASLHDKIGGYSTDQHFAMDIDFVFRAVSNAYCNYVNKTLGNFRLIPGTKTHESEQSNKDYIELLKIYTKKLPAHQRIFVTFLRAVASMRLF